MDDLEVLAMLDDQGELSLIELTESLSEAKAFKARTRKATKLTQTREKLAEFVDAGLVKARYGGARNLYSLTDLGSKHLDEILG